MLFHLLLCFIGSVHLKDLESLKDQRRADRQELFSPTGNAATETPHQ